MRAVGHVVGKDLYLQLGKKSDGLTMRAPQSERLYAILEELYAPEDAELIVKMPFGLSRLERLERVTKIPRAKLQPQLEDLCTRGLVMDVDIDGHAWYAPPPMVIGIFEFTMMRTAFLAAMKQGARKQGKGAQVDF